MVCGAGLSEARASHAGSQARPHARLANVDALRCFAMTAVVAQHSGLLPFGWMGVWLFFVISGFVVNLALLGPDMAPRGDLAGFFRRRSARIAPIYYGYVLLAVAAAIATGQVLDPLAVASLAGFFNNAAMILGRGEIPGSPMAHLWTISTEMQFYLVYGVAFFLLPRRGVVVLLVTLLLAGPLMRALVAARLAALGWGAEPAGYAVYAGPFLHVDAFAIGALLAFACRAGKLAALARGLALSGFVALAAYAACYVWVNWAIRGATGVDLFRGVISGILFGEYREILVYCAVNLASAGLVALAATDDPLIRLPLRSRLARRIGEISYGAYVYHAAALYLVSIALRHSLSIGEDLSFAERSLLFGGGYIATLLLAEFSYRHIETRFFRRRPLPPVTRASA
ncbi:acyltransferase family protein [Amaricoccus sp. W119]|uniref:acyltransferase family protein n=1 Tax=Amaricoccus sp. W119 TaxID=3391833 RepID=UPI0039A46ED0